MLDPKSKPSSAWSYLWKGIGNGPRLQNQSTSSSTSSTTSKSTFDEENIAASTTVSAIESSLVSSSEASTDKSIKILCDTMKRQIISRAFYGWFAHVRHLRTVRTHLAGLVNTTIIEEAGPTDASTGLTKIIWEEMHDSKGAISQKNAEEAYRLIYFGGVEASIRTSVWPYLMSHYRFGQTRDERKQTDQDVQQHYEITMTEWLAVEAIVRQRDKERMAANLAKLSSESTFSSDMPLSGPKGMVNDSNDVFTDSEISSSDMEVEDGEGEDEQKDGSEKKSKEKVAAKAKTRVDKVATAKMVRQRQLDSQSSQTQSIIVTNASIDVRTMTLPEEDLDQEELEGSCSELLVGNSKKRNSEGQLVAENAKSPCISPASSNGGVYSVRAKSLSKCAIRVLTGDLSSSSFVSTTCAGRTIGSLLIKCTPH